jgi:hypothetical protein
VDARVLDLVARDLIFGHGLVGTEQPHDL